MKRNYVLVPRNENQEMNVSRTLSKVELWVAFAKAGGIAATIQSQFPEASITCAIYDEADYLAGKEPRAIAWADGQLVNNNGDFIKGSHENKQG